MDIDFLWKNWVKFKRRETRDFPVVQGWASWVHRTGSIQGITSTFPERKEAGEPYPCGWRHPNTCGQPSRIQKLKSWTPLLARAPHTAVCDSTYPPPWTTFKRHHCISNNHDRLSLSLMPFLCLQVLGNHSPDSAYLSMNFQFHFYAFLMQIPLILCPSLL